MTRIADLLAAGQTYSFEFFPPKNDHELKTLARTSSRTTRMIPTRKPANRAQPVRPDLTPMAEASQ